MLSDRLATVAIFAAAWAAFAIAERFRDDAHIELARVADKIKL